MKAAILNTEGKETKQIELPGCFNEAVRHDLIKKVYESEMRATKHSYGNYIWAGMEHSASGIWSHTRRKYKTLYGYAISRVPRKILSRRHGRFNWVGATIAGAVGGREAHPPKVEKVLERKINKKEKSRAIRAAIAATANINELMKKYSLLNEEKEKIKNMRLPLIVESKIEDIKKTKELKEILEKILGPLTKVAFREKKVRAGKGKARGRKYKVARGLLIVSEKEIPAAKSLIGCGINNVSAKSLAVNQLAPGGIAGRITIYTENAINSIKNIERLK